MSNAPVDPSKLSPEDRAFYDKYGKLPPTKQILSSRLKYFDSGDYALSKVGKSSEVGSAHPSPERIPHSIPASMKKDAAVAPRESSHLHSATNTDTTTE